MDSISSTKSSLRERIVEHVFIGDALRTLWQKRIVDVEVLRSEFDAHGYDLVLCHDSIVRHIQLKTQKAKKVKINLSLAEKPSGCIIWVGVDEHLNLKHYWWFGGLPGQPLPDIKALKTATHTRRNKAGIRPERANHRIVPQSKFERLENMDELLIKLFGEMK